MVDWCRAKVSHLIDKFREHPILWDVRCVDEKNKNRKAEALDEISRSLHVPVEEVTKKLHSLKVQFSREYCRVRREKQKAGRTYIPKWYGYEQLLFLKDANTRLHRRSFVTEDPDPDDCNSFANSNSDDLSVISVNSIKEERASPLTDEKELLTPFKRKLPPDTIPPESFNHLQDNSHVYIPPSNNNDEFTAFGSYIANKLKAINDPYLQALAKHHLNKVIFNIEMKQLQHNVVNNNSKNLQMENNYQNFQGSPR